MISAIRNQVRELRYAQTVQERDRIIDKVLGGISILAKRVDPVEYGRKGGMTTAKRGSDYFRMIAAMRKTRSGGRPRKQSQQ